MNSAVFDALSHTEVNNLLRRTIEVITAALPADHLFLQDLGAIDVNSRFNLSIGWDRATAAGLANTLVELSRAPRDCAEMKDITPDSDHMQGKIYAPAPVLLEKYNLGAGMFVIVPCRDGNLAAFAGYQESGTALAGSDAVFLRSMLNILCLAVESEHAELAHSRNMQQVVQAKHQWESTLDALPQLMCMLDTNGQVIRSNRTLEAWGLGDVASVRGKQVHEVMHPGCTDRQCALKAKFEDMWQQLAKTGYVECEYHNPVLESDLRCSINKCKKPHYEDDEEVAGYAFLVVEDISLQKRAERVMQDYNEELEKQLQEKTTDLTKANAALRSELEGHMRDGAALRASEKKYTCLVETTLAGLYVMQNDHIVFCNNRFAEIFGYTQEEIGTLDIQTLFPPDTAGVSAGMNGTITDAEWASEEQIIKGVTRYGRSLWLQSNLTRVDCSNELMIMGNIIDITEQKNTEDALRLSKHELKILSGKLLKTQEAERKRIASDLHDSIGQSISAIKFGLENAMREYESSLPESGRLCLRGAISKLRDTIDEVRHISMNLRPSMLDDLGLKATIKWFIREYGAVFPSISMDYKIEIAESDLSDLQNIVIFRIIQESLNNIGKHAEASNVSVELLDSGDRLTLTVKDDGKGFSTEALYAGQGFGLSGMRDRVKLTDGELAIESAPGAGTLVRAVWPGIVEHSGDSE